MKMYEEMESTKKKPRGRPVMNIAQVVKEDLKRNDMTKNDAQNRMVWKNARCASPRRGSRMKKAPNKLKDYLVGTYFYSICC